MRKNSLLILLTLVLSISALSQKKDEKPNFSGVWNLDKSKSTFTKRLKAFYIENNQLDCSNQLIINHKEPKFNVRELLYCYEKNNPQINSTTVIEDAIFYTDYRGEKNNIPDYVILSTKTKWSEWKIIIRNRLDNSITEYFLSDGGKTLTERTYHNSNNKNLNKNSDRKEQKLIYYLSKN